MSANFHIVTAAHGISGAMTYAATLEAMIRSTGHRAILWLDTPGQSGLAAKTIQAFSGSFPRGDTLILVGCYLKLEPWIAHAKPKRLIVICNTSDPTQTFRMLATLAQAGLPSPEIVYVSSRLRDTIGIPGRLCPEVVDTALFTPAVRESARRFTVGRLSRDDPDKHHSDDPSLYRMLAWNGASIRIMGGTCFQPMLNGEQNIDLLPAGHMAVNAFLQGLDVFFYRTSNRLHEAAGRVVIEAMACGLPVVAHISGGYTDWIKHGQNGFLFERQEEAWQYLMQLKLDIGLRHSLSRSARETAEGLAALDSQPAQVFLQWLLE